MQILRTKDKKQTHSAIRLKRYIGKHRGGRRVPGLAGLAEPIRLPVNSRSPARVSGGSESPGYQRYVGYRWGNPQVGRQGSEPQKQVQRSDIREPEDGNIRRYDPQRI